MSNANPQLVAAILQALQATPEWQFAKRAMEEEIALGGPEKHTHRFGTIAAVGAHAPRLSLPANYGGQSAPEKYAERLAALAVQVHEEHAATGKQPDYATCRAEAERRIRSGRGAGPEKYTQRHGADVEQVIADLAIETHELAAERGENLSYAECRREACRRMGLAA
jgi:hypothetical protein